MKKKIVIAVKIGNAVARLDYVKATIESIFERIGVDDFLLVLGISPNTMAKDIRQYITDKVRNLPNKVKLIRNNKFTWAEFVNQVIREYAKDYKWFLGLHDDVKLITDGLIPKIESIVNEFIEPIGWITPTDIDYKNGHWTPPARGGFAKDCMYEDSWKKRNQYQYHTTPLDFPSKSVKVHAPWSNFMLIESRRLLEIGMCENWSPCTLLVDEDWGLRALEMNLWNIWIPNIEILHLKEQESTRTVMLFPKYQEHVHSAFSNKWGFHQPLEASDLAYIKDKYKRTNIIWSMGRRTWEWDYVM